MGRVQNISVLFTDLVGSTALTASMSPEAADELRRAHFGVLRRAIAETDGTEVKNLGDGLMVVFTTASAALACAVAMQQATELDNRSRHEPFGLRVGVSAGEVVEEDGDYFGDPVVEAARLCAQCEAGEILASDVVRATAGRRNPHRCEPVGDLELKGLPEPVATVRVCWEPIGTVAETERVPLPGRLLGAPAFAFVGRSVERATLLDAAKRAASGAGREAVVVAGEAGVGKSTLVAEVARRAFDDGACVVFGHAEEDLATPYGMFAEALGHLITHAPEDDLRAYVAECGTDLARIVPALLRRLPEIESPPERDAETERFLLFASVVGLVRHVTRERPMVLVVDDLQWADAGSLQLLRHLLGDDVGLRLLVLATFRDSEVASGHPLVETLAALWRMVRVTRIDLQGLDDRGVVDLLESIAGYELDDTGIGLAHALHRETDGNPFFLSEVLRHLVETGTIYRDESKRWVSDLTLDELRLPDSIREVVGARVARLGPEATRVLATAAVIGRDFDLELLARATRSDEDDLVDLLEAAEKAALVREPTTVGGRFTFTHALIQRTLYQDLSPARRARTHKRVAEALEDLTAGHPGSRIGELAHHWAHAASPADTAKAIGYAVAAGDAALKALAPAEAVRWYQQALELLGADGDRHRRAEILVGLGEAQRQSGIAAHRETLLEAGRIADDTDDVELLVRAVLANNRGWSSNVGSADEDRLALIDRALERTRDWSPEIRAPLLALAAAERTYASPLSERLALAEEAVQTARSSGDPAVFVAALVRLGSSIEHPSTVAIRSDWLREGCEVADQLGDPVARYHAHTAATIAALARADRQEFDAHEAARNEIATSVAAADIRWRAMYHSAWVARFRGDLHEYEQRAESALVYGIENQQADAFLIYSVQLGNVRWHQGRLHEMVPLVEQAMAENPGIHTYRAALALARAHGGDHDAVAATLRDAAADGFALPEDNAWATGMACWSYSIWLTRTADVVPVLRPILQPYHDQLAINGAQFHHSFAHFLGLLEHVAGEYEAAEHWFEEALQLHTQVGAPLLIAATNAAYATALADRGRGDDHERARTMAHAALDAATRGGYGYVEADARAVLARLS